LEHLKQVRSASTPRFDSYADNFRIEVRGGTSVVLVHPVAWYCALPAEVREQAVAAWAKRLKRRAGKPRQDPNLPSQCRFPTTCKDTSCKSKRAHSRVVCSRCGYALIEQLYIDDLSTEHYIVQARKELSRELLVFPRPFCNHGCITNEGLVRSDLFWRAVALIISKIASLVELPHPVECVALNFGNWESANAEPNTTGASCHGHAHLILTREAQQLLALKYTQMSGRCDDPYCYDEDNIDLLQKFINEEKEKAEKGTMQHHHACPLWQPLEICTHLLD
jgi:hypothetical protein